LWKKFIDTAAETPGDIYPNSSGPALSSNTIKLAERSLVCFVATKPR
jgi:hypothetical protein